ncbi:MAG: RNA methyltransferase [Cyanobacteriota bacterium]|nr:RNA methyltransferase [Cyanobacteriota bacterium]
MTLSQEDIKIVLVEPAGPLNVGSVARVMKNMGLKKLVLVNPKCDYLGEEAKLMAVRAREILETATVVGSLPEALRGCEKAIATTGGDTSLPTEIETPKAALPWLLNAPSALIFGREDRGLSNTELNYAQRLVRIPASEVYDSLNLAQAAAVCCYELYQASLEIEPGAPEDRGENVDPPRPPLSRGEVLKPSTRSSPATLDALEGYYQHFEDVLLEIGYLYPHTAASRMEKFRRLFNRAELSSAEVTMLRGILSQIKWALKSRERE